MLGTHEFEGCYASLVTQMVKNLPAMQETRVQSLCRKIPGEGQGTHLQYSRLENPMDRGAWQATVHGVTQSRTWVSDWRAHTSSSWIVSTFLKHSTVPGRQEELHQHPLGPLRRELNCHNGNVVLWLPSLKFFQTPSRKLSTVCYALHRLGCASKASQCYL